MKTLSFIAIVCSFLAGMAGADVTAPANVEYGEYGAIEAALTDAPGDAGNGAALMDKGSGNCVACHQISDLADVPFQGEIGPALDGVGDRWSEAEIRGIVANAKKVFPGTMMPAFYKVEGFVRPGEEFTGEAPEGPLEPMLTAQQVEDVVAYLMTLKEE